MPRTHNYEEEYDEYDKYLDIDSALTIGQLRNRIQRDFKLNEVSANMLAEKLWEIKTRDLEEIDDIELEDTQQREPPKPFSRVNDVETITEWRIEARRKGVSEAYVKRIENYLKKYPQATLQQARGHRKGG